MIKIKVKLASGQVIEEVVDKSSAIIGRSQKSDVVIPDDSLSRSHCQIDYDGENFFITDLGSANGVSIDAKKIEQNKKIQFSTFQELLIGPLELTVVYEDEGFKFTPGATKSSSPKPKMDEKSDATTKARAINKDALNKPFVTKDTPSKKKEKNGLTPIYALVFLVIAGAVYYQFQVKEPSVPQDNASANIPTGVTLPDEFLSDKDYLLKDEQKSCTSASEATCKELGLTAEAAEGVLQDGQQYYLFIRPFAHLNEPKFARIKELEDKDDLIGIYLALRSPAFESFRKKEILQVHLIIRGEDYKPSKVYRFHTKYYSSNGPEKSRLVSELITIFDGGSSANFWKEANPIIQKKNL